MKPNSFTLKARTPTAADPTPILISLQVCDKSACPWPLALHLAHNWFGLGVVCVCWGHVKGVGSLWGSLLHTCFCSLGSTLHTKQGSASSLGAALPAEMTQGKTQLAQRKLGTLLDLCVSSLRRGHANRFRTLTCAGARGPPVFAGAARRGAPAKTGGPLGIFGAVPSLLQN